MHEWALAEQIIKIIEQESTKYRLDKIIRVNVKTGIMRGVVPDILEFAFKILTEDTELKKSQLHIEKVPLVIGCIDCLQESIFQTTFGIYMVCPYCNSSKIKIMSGNEFLIDSIEVDNEKN